MLKHIEHAKWFYCNLCSGKSQETSKLSVWVSQMGDRVGPVGTGEASFSTGAQRLSPNWSMGLHQQQALVSAEFHDDYDFT